MNRKPLALLAAFVSPAMAGTTQAQPADVNWNAGSLQPLGLVADLQAHQRHRHRHLQGRAVDESAVSAKALGLTAGKWQIDHGTGNFSDVHNINDVLGNYAQASANVGLAKSGEAQVMTNGPGVARAGGCGRRRQPRCGHRPVQDRAGRQALM